MSKILTVIVPTYNMEKYLDKCLSSLIISDKILLSTLEVIVVNDGSKDSSSDIAHKYAVRYSDIFRVIDKPNGNYGSCINAGLPVSTGKYVKILDADDFFDLDNFSNYLKQIQSVDVDLILNDKTTVDSSYQITGRQIIPLEKGKEYSFGKLSNCWEAIDMHKMAYRRILLIEMGYIQTEGISYSDAEWMIKPFTLIQSAYYTGENVYCYLQGRTGQTIDNKVRRNSFSSLNKLLISIGDYWKNYSGNKERMDFLTQYFIYSVINIYREFFFTTRFDEKAFRQFDSIMISRFPDIMQIVDSHQWVSFIPNLHLTKDWRENKKVKFCLEYSLIRMYLKIRGKGTTSK